MSLLEKITRKLIGHNQSLIQEKEFDLLKNTIQELKVLQAQALIEKNRRKDIENFREVEFKVFSQWGDDGIIQFLINKINISSKIFVEFGVQDYTESNTRFLLINNNWKGVVMDGSGEFIDFIKNDWIYWKYDLNARQAFVTAENINNLLEEENITGEIGLYNVDVDGNDYWIWQATTVINPIIVVSEYQSLFGCERSITIPYEADFVRQKAHYSHLYYGVSLQALCDLAEEKGYAFVGCNSGGNNAYFVRKDKLETLKALTAKEGFVLAHFRESRHRDGRLSFASGADRRKLISGLPVFNTRTKQIEML